ncbi:hypothetical protein TVAGG3_0631520, partial [Trichomonas vaginalis G3]
KYLNATHMKILLTMTTMGTRQVLTFVFVKIEESIQENIMKF